MTSPQVQPNVGRSFNFFSSVKTLAKKKNPRSRKNDPGASLEFTSWTMPQRCQNLRDKGFKLQHCFLVFLLILFLSFFLFPLPCESQGISYGITQGTTAWETVSPPPFFSCLAICTKKTRKKMLQLSSLVTLKPLAALGYRPGSKRQALKSHCIFSILSQ